MGKIDTLVGFDEEFQMVKLHTGSAQEIYHTRLADTDVHGIKDTSAYAADRIICDKNYELGLKLFKKVIDLQDKNPKSKTYGLWPWFAEETLEEMETPDYNMADFNSKEMIVSLLEAGDAIGGEIREELLASIERACICIMNRGVGPEYTNVCITDCFVTVSAGELLGNRTMIEYGRNMLKRFLAYTRTHGEIAEYNSPNYSILTINDIGDFLRYIKDEQTLESAKAVNFMLWQMLAEHFDYETLQLNGPQERAYEDFVNVEFLKTVGNGCGIDYSRHPKFLKYFDKTGMKQYHSATRRHPSCPPELIPYFTGDKKFTYVRKMVTDGYNFPWFEFPKVATTYRGDGYAIGTYNKSELWNQRRPFVGYIYTDEKDISFRVKCYHDGFEFASGDIHLVQNMNEILGSVNFAENRGDTHVNLDMISDGLVSAEDLRVSFEFCGDTEKISYQQQEAILLLEVNGVKIRINPFIREFGNVDVKTEIKKEENRFSYNIVLYHGERRIVDLCDAKKAVVMFTVEFSPDSEYLQPVWKEEKDMIRATWKPTNRELQLLTPKKTLTFLRNMSEDYEAIDGKNLCIDLFMNEE